MRRRASLAVRRGDHDVSQIGQGIRERGDPRRHHAIVIAEENEWL
jgi:hypothetical protein